MPAAPSEPGGFAAGQGKGGHAGVPRVTRRCWPQPLLLDRFSHDQLLHEYIPNVTRHVPSEGAEHEPLVTGPPPLSYSLPTLTPRPADRKKPNSYFIIKCIARQLRKVWQHFAVKVVNIYRQK